MQRIAVIGGGIMGSGIAEVCLRSGCDVVVVESTAAFADKARQRMTASLDRAVAKGKLTADVATDQVSRLNVVTELDAVADRELVIEAIPEIAELKFELFEHLDKLTPETAILASNTSSIPIAQLAAATRRPDRVVGVHFFNPATVLPLVEIVSSLLTSDETRSTVEDFARGQLGKHTIRAQDRSGFVVNALLIPFVLSAIRMLEAGYASASDIDDGMVKGCAHPQGPLALADLIGLDTTMAVAVSMYEEFKEPLYAPPPLLRRMVDAGLLGRKSGRGFFEYAG